MKNSIDFLECFGSIDLYSIKRDISRYLSLIIKNPDYSIPLMYEDVYFLVKNIVLNSKTHIFDSHDPCVDYLINIESNADQEMIFDYVLLPDVDRYDYSKIINKIETLLNGITNKYVKRTFNVVFYFMVDGKVKFRFADLKSLKKNNSNLISKFNLGAMVSEDAVLTNKIDVKSIFKTDYSKIINSTNFLKKTNQLRLLLNLLKVNRLIKMI